MATSDCARVCNIGRRETGYRFEITTDTRMAGHAVSPGIFKSKDAEPEATLELFSDYCETMERVFRLRRRIHPTTGARIEFDDAEKKDEENESSNCS